MQHFWPKISSSNKHNNTSTKVVLANPSEPVIQLPSVRHSFNNTKDWRTPLHVGAGWGFLHSKRCVFGSVVWAFNEWLCKYFLVGQTDGQTDIRTKCVQNNVKCLLIRHKLRIKCEFGQYPRNRIQKSSNKPTKHKIRLRQRQSL